MQDLSHFKVKKGENTLLKNVYTWKYEVVSLPNIEIGFGINALPCKWNKLESGLHENFILCSCTWSSNVGIQVFVWIVFELVGFKQSNHALLWWNWLDPCQIHVCKYKLPLL
jgi:hypothetical protein